MEKINLSDFVNKEVMVKYPNPLHNPEFTPSTIDYIGIITCDEIHGRPYYHLVYKNKVNNKDCIQTIFLREENLCSMSKDSTSLISEKDFCPIWTHYKNSSDKEYAELEKTLSEN